MILDSVPFSSDWGLKDISLFRLLSGLDKQNRSLLNRICYLPVRVLRFIDNADNFVASAISYITGELIGNLKLYICKAIK